MAGGYLRLIEQSQRVTEPTAAWAPCGGPLTGPAAWGSVRTAVDEGIPKSKFLFASQILEMRTGALLERAELRSAWQRRLSRARALFLSAGLVLLTAASMERIVVWSSRCGVVMQILVTMPLLAYGVALLMARSRKRLTPVEFGALGRNSVMLKLLWPLCVCTVSFASVADLLQASGGSTFNHAPANAVEGMRNMLVWHLVSALPVVEDLPLALGWQPLVIASSLGASLVIAAFKVAVISVAISAWRDKSLAHDEFISIAYRWMAQSNATAVLESAIMAAHRREELVQLAESYVVCAKLHQLHGRHDRAKRVAAFASDILWIQHRTDERVEALRSSADHIVSDRLPAPDASKPTDELANAPRWARAVSRFVGWFEA